MELLIAILNVLDNCYKAMTAEDIAYEIRAFYALEKHYDVDQVEYALGVLEGKQLVYQTLPTAYRPVTIYMPAPRKPERVKPEGVIERFFRVSRELAKRIAA